MMFAIVLVQGIGIPNDKVFKKESYRHGNISPDFIGKDMLQRELNKPPC